ncbi:MAG TPA: serine/threonine-protein kinase [Kofleriaceae bacterium]
MKQIVGSDDGHSGDQTLPVSAEQAAALSTAPPGVLASESRRYTLGALLGQGGMGEVVLAVDEQIGREVAIKRIRSERPSPEELSRFVREARVQGRLQHPAVVPVHDLAYDGNGKPYFVMKRLSGTTMTELLEELRRMTDPGEEAALRRRLMRAFVDVCLAIELAHTQGIVHRDIKPANIMLGDFGEVYILDWGVARALGEADEVVVDSGAKAAVGLELDSGETRHGTVLGTPAYMAPEQMTGDRAGPSADLYALGCILYEIASGQLLHDKRRSVTQLLRPLDARPSRARAESPPELDAICVRATKLDPVERFASARAVGEAVQAFLDGDRDVAVRRELAAHHVTTARAALEAGTEGTARQTAIMAAGRALALDPTSSDAAAIVSRLLLEPPKEIPAEVEAAVIAKDVDSARSQGQLAALSLLGYFAFVPLLLWAGVRQMSLLVAFVALVVVSAAQIYTLTRGDRISLPRIYLNAATNALIIAVVCRFVGPFIIAPALVFTTLMAYAAHPSFGRLRYVSVILGAGVVVPWGLEIAGLIPRTYEFVDGQLRIFSPNLTFSSMPVQIGCALLLVALMTVVALLTRVLAVRQRDANRQLELQAWHLRQILPVTR